MDKGGQQVGPSVGPIARLQQANRDLIAQLKQGNRDMKADVELLKKDIRCLENTIERLKAETELLRELQVAAEAIEGPGHWFHKDIRPQIVALHKAIRNVRGMK